MVAAVSEKPESETQTGILLSLAKEAHRKSGGDIEKAKTWMRPRLTEEVMSECREEIIELVMERRLSAVRHRELNLIKTAARIGPLARDAQSMRDSDHETVGDILNWWIEPVGKPLGDCTPEELQVSISHDMARAEGFRLRARFQQLICQRCKPGIIIRKQMNKAQGAALMREVYAKGEEPPHRNGNGHKNGKK